ncbi:MAG: phosphatidate cytidylyltransferase [Acidimicrobiia bacterium]
MTDRTDDDGTPAPPARSNPEGVRILGAEEAQAALEGGQVARRRGDDEPRYGDVPPRPDQPSRPTVRFPRGEVEAGHDQPPPGVESVVAPSAGEPSGPVKLPHWTEPPTGDVLQVLPEAEPVDLTGEEDAEGWASLTGEAPRFRSSAADWSGADFQPDESLKDEATSVGALAAPPPDLDDDAAFEAEVQARRRRGTRRISATAGTGAAGAAGAGPGAAAEPSAPVQPGAPGPAPEAAGAAAGAAAAPRMTRVRKRPGLETEGAATPGPVPAPAPTTPGARIATGFVIAAVALLCLLLGPRSATVLVMAIVGVGIVELYTAFQQQGYHPATLVGTVGAVALTLAAYNYGESAFLLVTALVVVFSMLWYLFEVVRARPVVNLGLTLLPYAYVGFLGGFGGLLLHARPSNSGVGLLLGLAVCAVGHDVFGYVIGSQFGHKPITPKVSPNKTLEGLLGGMAASVILGVFFVAVLQVSPWDHSSHGKFFVGLALGLTVAVMAPLGDLCESLLKRDLGLKDLGSILPGHGGVLDRFDAMLFCLPAVYYLATWLKIG